MFFIGVATDLQTTSISYMRTHHAEDSYKIITMNHHHGSSSRVINHHHGQMITGRTLAPSWFAREFLMSSRELLDLSEEQKQKHTRPDQTSYMMRIRSAKNNHQERHRL